MAKERESGMRQLEIKKYANRRYYDSSRSGHLTLKRIRELIQQGHDLRITEAKSGRDITVQVLAQIILELDRPKLDRVPVSLLIWLIRASDESVVHLIEKNFKQESKVFFEYEAQLQQLHESHDSPTPLPIMAKFIKSFTATPDGAFASGEKKGPAIMRPGVGIGSSSSEDFGELMSELKSEINAERRGSQNELNTKMQKSQSAKKKQNH